MNQGMAWEIAIPQTEKPKSLENFLKKRFPIGYVRKLFRKNGVRLNGKRCGADKVVSPGDLVTLFIPFEKQPGKAAPTPPPERGWQVLFEDEEILIINKAAGIAVHEGKAIPKSRSLLGMLEAALRPRDIVPKLVHRIDRETSGLLVVAKREDVAEEMERRFAGSEVEKEYVALVMGRCSPLQGEINFPLPGRDGRPVSALTHYTVEREFAGATLVCVKIETGRMHQVRLHFAKLGHPVVMDDRYGNFAFNKQFRKTHNLKRQFLHARAIAFEHRGKKRKWSAPLPEDLAQTLSSLRSESQIADPRSHS